MAHECRPVYIFSLVILIIASNVIIVQVYVCIVCKHVTYMLLLLLLLF
jgi:hypothetical protein